MHPTYIERFASSDELFALIERTREEVFEENEARDLGVGVGKLV